MNRRAQRAIPLFQEEARSPAKAWLKSRYLFMIVIYGRWQNMSNRETNFQFFFQTLSGAAEAPKRGIRLTFMTKKFFFQSFLKTKFKEVTLLAGSFFS